MAKIRPKQSKPSNPSTFWLEMQENFTREALGILIFLAGGYFGFSLLVSGEAAWIARAVGWTAGLVALALLLLGIVLMLGERAGYWNPQAVVGAELTLLGLQTGAFLMEHAQADWMPPVGSAAGWLGWALGNLLVETLGRWPALMLVLIVLAVGIYLLFRHTPLIYLTPYVMALAPSRLQRTAETEPAQIEPRKAQNRRIPPPPIDPVIPTPVEADPPAADPAPKSRSAPAAAPTAPAPGPPARAKTPQPAPTKLQVVRTPDRLPALDLLEGDSGRYGSRDTKRTEEMIEQTLADFNIPVRIVNVESGPTVTQYGVEPLYIERAGQRRKVRVSRIVNLADDLALALAAPSVRIEAPVPGHPYVGIEVPNHDKVIVGIRGILESSEMGKRGGNLPIALGRDTAGAPVVTDLTRAPHLLIAGATGSGKSVCVNAMIISLLMHHGPDTLRFVMVDPKMVELPGYNGIPHLIGKVITEVDQVVGALTWLLLQMDDRYQRFRDAKVRNIGDYNAKAAKSKDLQPLPYIVLVVDELADLMMTAPEDVERQLVRLAQMARATGVHMILATQRPSTDVVTGLIKANFSTRIAFAVTSQIDSRVVLDSNGAEKLLGQGDMLFMSPSAAKLSRVQGCWVSDKEIERVVKFWQEQERIENPNAPLMKVAPWIGILDQLDDEEELLNDVIDLIRDQESVTTSFVQRKLRIGYPKAARMMEQLEAKGLVGPDQGGGQGRVVKIKDDDDVTGDR
ncbi:MAG: DNA translocase FtsK [Caldilineaceae bacterium]|nr:DNA translocase FtsK [Caldilineaceae bacterium]